MLLIPDGSKTKHQSTDEDLPLAEINQAVDKEEAILLAGKGGIAGREILVQGPGLHCDGSPQGIGGIHHSFAGGQQYLCHSCKKGNDHAQGYAPGKANAW